MFRTTVLVWTNQEELVEPCSKFLQLIKCQNSEETEFWMVNISSQSIF